MTKGIICIADTHFHSSPEENKILEERLASLLFIYPDSYLAIAGDVTDNGEPEEYAEATRILAPWKNRIFLAPGNHDLGTLGLIWKPEAVKRWLKFSTDLGNVADALVDPWRICVLDSTVAEESVLHLAQGNVGDAEMERARLAIEEGHAQGYQVVLLMHHTPVDAIRQGSRELWDEVEGGFQDWSEKLQDSAAFLKLAYGKTEYIVAGHSHMNRVWTSTPSAGPIPTLLRSLSNLRTSDVEWQRTAVQVLA